MPVKFQIGELSISQSDGNVTTGAPAAAKMEALYTYKVPRQTEIKIRPSDVISAYLKDAGAESLVTDTWELWKQDPNGVLNELIASGTYNEIKEFADVNKLKKLRNVFYIPSDFLLVFKVKTATIVVTNSCYYRISCTRRIRIS